MTAAYWATIWDGVSHSDRETIAALQRCPLAALPSAWERADHWQRVVDGLPPATYALVQRIRRAGGSMPAGFVEAVAGPLRSNLDALSPRAFVTIHDPLSPLEHAYAAGVVWPGQKRDNQRVWTVPTQIAHALSAVPPLFDEPPVADMPMLPAFDVDGLLVAVAGQIRAGGVQMARGGRPPQRLVSVGAQYGADALAVQWLIQICLAGHAVVIGAHGLQIGPALDDWLRAAPQVRRLELVRAWLTAAWNDWELTDVPPVRSIELRVARRCVAYALLPHLPEAWLAADTYLSQIRLRWPDIVRPVSLQHRWQRPGEWPQGWETQDGAVVDMFVRGPLWWLGCVEWDSERRYFRRSRIGSWICGLTHIEEQKRSASVSFEADFSCILRDPHDVWARYQLAAIGDVRDASSWQLSPQSIQRAVAHGTPLAAIVDTIAELTGEPVVPAARQQLALWAGQVTVVQISHTVLLQTQHAQALRDVTHDRRLGVHGGEPLNDTTLRIDPAGVERLVGALQLAGYGVEVVGAAPPLLRENELVLLERALRAYRDNAATRALSAKLRALRTQDEHDG